MQSENNLWKSTAIGRDIQYTVIESEHPTKDYAQNMLTVVYLENLAFKKLGGNSNAVDVNWLLSHGYRVVELNYEHDTMACFPNIHRDIMAINKALASGSFCGLSNCSKYRSYVLFEGYRIERDVAFYKDDPTVYNYPNAYLEYPGDSLYMDIIYPANSSDPVPVLLSFSYSNSSFGLANNHQRLHLGYTLSGFDDTILEGAPAVGMAWAIADHPKYCPWGNGKPAEGQNDTYKSYQVNPDAARKVKSAIRTVRNFGAKFNFSDKIGIYGFSRGSDAGAMAIGDRMVEDFENSGLFLEQSSKVQAAVLGPGVFDFTQIYNVSNDGDGNLETRCPWAWGPLNENFSVWEKQGAAYLAETNATAPVLFFNNSSDAAYYQDQINKFNAKLINIGVETELLSNFGKGHAVPKTETDLMTVYTFLQKHLNAPSVTNGIDPMLIHSNSFDFKIIPNPVEDFLQIDLRLNNACSPSIEIYDLKGLLLYRSLEDSMLPGLTHKKIDLTQLSFGQGIYFIKIQSNQESATGFFIKK